MTRLDRLIEKMRAEGFESLIISDPIAIEYLSGELFAPGNRMLTLVVEANGGHRLYLNELFPLEQYPHKIVRFSDTDKPVELLAKSLGNGKIGIDKNWPAHFLIDLIKALPNIKLAHGSRLVDELRQRKDSEEIQAMKAASALNDQAMEQLIGRIEPGMTELQLKAILGEIYQELGAEGFGFDVIIGFGANAADPHHATSDTVLTANGPLVIDIGCKLNRFYSDMTRTVHLGEPSEEFEKVYEIVRAANLNAIALVRPGVTFREIDEAARSTIEQAGYGEYFTHRTGHSIGREVHEFGDVSASNHQTLEPGMIFSIEPGIYLPGQFGVRIEDLVLVTSDGVDVLNHVTKNLRRI